MRFKTKEEFEKEFGPDWRNQVGSWRPEYDGFLGQHLPSNKSRNGFTFDTQLGDDVRISTFRFQNYHIIDD
jgi:hypothetical protein